MAGKVLKFLDTIIELSICLLIFCLPFSNSLVEIFSITPIVALIIKKILLFKLSGNRDDLKPVETGLNKWLYVFLLFSFCATFFGVDVAHGLKKWLTVYLQKIALFFVIAEAFTDFKKIKKVLYVIAGSVFFMLVDLVVQRLTGVDFIRGIAAHNVQRLNASFSNPNDFGAWISCFIPVTVGIWMFFSSSFGKGKKIFSFMLFFFILCFCFWGLFYASSRGAFFGVILGLVFMFLFVKNKLFLVPMFLLIVMVFLNSADLKSRIQTGLVNDLTVNKVNKERIDLWKDAVVVIRNNPVFGVGTGNYMKATAYPSYAHNSYLQLAAENGLPSLFLFVFLLALFFLQNIRLILYAKEKSQSTCVLLGFFSGVLVFLFHASVDTHFASLKIFMLLWILMGLTVALRRDIESIITIRDNK